MVKSSSDASWDYFVTCHSELCKLYCFVFTVIVCCQLQKVSFDWYSQRYTLSLISGEFLNCVKYSNCFHCNFYLTILVRRQSNHQSFTFVNSMDCLTFLATSRLRYSNYSELFFRATATVPVKNCSSPVAIAKRHHFLKINQLIRTK